MRADAGELPRKSVAALEACFFVSGAAGLIYEVLWSRYLALCIGSTGRAQVVVLCAFMGGLALGSHLFGRIADRCRSPLLWYAMLEVAIGLYAFAFESIFSVGREMFLILVRVSGVESGGWMPAKIVCSVLTMLLPTLLMGGTFPMLSRHMIRSLGGAGPRISRLYFVNSLGAAVGCMAAGFWLIHALGLSATMNLGGVMNLLSGFGAWIVLARTPAQTLPVAMGASEAAGGLSRGMSMWVLAAAGMSGAVSMIYEVAWIRMLALVMGSSTYAFSMMLTTFILGLGIGGWILSLRKKTTGYGWIFALSSIGVGLSILAMLPFYVRLPFLFNQLASTISRDPSAFATYQWVQFLLCLMVMIVPTILQGITLPAATKVLARDLGGLGRRIGLVFAVNTLGTMGGAIFAGFWSMPSLGMRGTLELAIALNMLVGIAMLCTAREHPLFRKTMAGALTVISLAWICYAALMGPWDRTVFTSGRYRNVARARNFQEFQQEALNRKTVFCRDGADATVAVQEVGGELVLMINGKPDASSIGDLPTQKLLGHLPMLINRRPENVLVIGIGSGATIGSVLTHDPKRIDVVEISRDVIEASRLFESVNGRYWEDPRVKIHCEDAKTFLQVSNRQYDVIISEPSNPWMAGVAGVFSREFYEICGEHLAPGGMLVQWLHAYEIESRTFFMIVETFQRSFPCWTLWNSDSRDVIFVGAAKPYGAPFKDMEARMGREPVAADLDKIGIGSLTGLLSLQMADFASVLLPARFSEVVHSDLNPVLDFEAPRGFYLKAMAGDITWIDGRADSPSNTPIWLPRYWKTHPPTRQQLAQTYRYAMDNIGVFPQQNLLWAQEWALRFPGDDAAQKAYRNLLGRDAPEVLERLKHTKGGDGSDSDPKSRAVLSYQDFNRTRGSLRLVNAEAALRDVREYLKTPEGKSDPLAHAWCGQILFDMGRGHEAVPYLVSAASTFRNLSYRNEQILAGVFLCRALLASQQFPEASRAYRDYVEPYADEIPARLMRGRIEAEKAAAR